MKKLRLFLMLILTSIMLCSCDNIKDTHNLELGERVTKICLNNEITINESMDSHEIFDILMQRYTFIFNNQEFNANIKRADYNIESSGKCYFYKENSLEAQTEYTYIESEGKDKKTLSFKKGYHQFFWIKTYPNIMTESNRVGETRGSICKVDNKLNAIGMYEKSTNINTSSKVYSNSNLPQSPLLKDKYRYAIEKPIDFLRAFHNFLNYSQTKHPKYYSIKAGLYSNYIVLEANNDYGIISSSFPEREIGLRLNKGYYLKLKMYINVNTGAIDYIYVNGKCDESTGYSSFTYKGQSIKIKAEDIIEKINKEINYIKENTDAS